jgi:type II secretory pathway component GspD/PulD (secretin)
VGVTLDAKTRTIIVAGDPKELQSLQNASVIIEQLDNALGQQPERKIKVVSLKQAKVSELLPKARQLYNDQLANKPELTGSEMLMLEDTPNNQIILAGSEGQMALLDTILTQLQAAHAAPPERDTRIYDLTTATASELATTVRSLYQEQAKDRPGLRLEDTAIFPDASANRLIVTAATNELAIVEDIIKKLDKVSAQSASVRVFKVKSAEPDKVAEILSSALVTYDAFGRPRKRVSISVDPKSRTIIAAGDPKELQGAQVVVEQLDTTLGGQPERRMTVLPVKAGKAADLLTKIRALYDDQVKAQPELAATDVLMLEDAASN